MGAMMPGMNRSSTKAIDSSLWAAGPAALRWSQPACKHVPECRSQPPPVADWLVGSPLSRRASLPRSTLAACATFYRLGLVGPVLELRPCDEWGIIIVYCCLARPPRTRTAAD